VRLPGRSQECSSDTVFGTNCYFQPFLQCGHLGLAFYAQSTNIEFLGTSETLKSLPAACIL
jgi:hypothetical protein